MENISRSSLSDLMILPRNLVNVLLTLTTNLLLITIYLKY